MAHKYKQHILVLLVSSILVFLMLVIVISITIVIIVREPSPSRAFMKFVCDPIPKSVKEIKVDRPFKLLGHRYIFYFRIDETEISPILKSRPFKEVQYVKYNDESGRLTWSQESPPNPYSEMPLHWKSHSLRLYKPYNGERDPEWFKLEQWDSPKVYVFEEEDVIRMRLLIYNKELGEAYFIDYRMPD